MMSAQCTGIMGLRVCGGFAESVETNYLVSYM
jgi:hypothetical protein